MNSIKLIQKEVSNPTDLRCNFYLKERIKPDTIDVLVVSFYGEYPNGSAGKLHADYIARKAIEGLMHFDIEAIVLDFRELTYNYGNSILKVFQDITQFKNADNLETEPNFPVLVVASDKSKKGLLSLLTPYDSNETPDWFFEDIDKAVVVATEKGRFWLDN